MFELSSRLVGIYKTDNFTKTICIDNKDINLLGDVGAVGAAEQSAVTEVAA
jgi:hypothetical protein